MLSSECESHDLLYSLPGLSLHELSLTIYTIGQGTIRDHFILSFVYSSILLLSEYCTDAHCLGLLHSQMMNSSLSFFIDSLLLFPVFPLFLCISHLSCIDQNGSDNTFIYSYFWLSVQLFIFPYMQLSVKHPSILFVRLLLVISTSRYLKLITCSIILL
jgi:hypothetical protein